MLTTASTSQSPFTGCVVELATQCHQMALRAQDPSKMTHPRRAVMSALGMAASNFPNPSTAVCEHIVKPKYVLHRASRSRKNSTVLS